MIKILLIGDYSDSVIAHQAIPKALDLAANSVSDSVIHEWIATEQISSPDSIAAKNPNAIWCAPGSPYRNTQGALDAIRFARESNIPFLGTCGGFQHALIEYARNVLKISDADHVESNPAAKSPIISKLACALDNKTEVLRIHPETRLAKIYGSWKTTEPYQCSYGFNSDFRKHFESAPMEFTTPLHFSAFNDELGLRAFELTNHPFFIGTLFQPERSALQGVIHPLIAAFVHAAATHNNLSR